MNITEMSRRGERSSEEGGGLGLPALEDGRVFPGLLLFFFFFLILVFVFAIHVFWDLPHDVLNLRLYVVETKRNAA